MNHPEISEQTILAQAILDAEPRTTILSFDPGGDSDHAALALITFAEAAEPYTRSYLCQRVRRIPLYTDYTTLESLIIQSYRDLVAARDAAHWIRWRHVGPAKRPKRGDIIALIERNGTGRGLIEALRRAKLEVIDVWTSGGTGYATQGAQFSVALVEIIHTLLRVWGQRRLLFADMEEAELDVLEQECRDYEHRLTMAGRPTYRSRPGSHDDVLRALAQGIAWCEHGQRYTVGTQRLLGW
jgi:hypothetical protein